MDYAKHPSPFIFSLGMPINTGASEKVKGEGRFAFLDTMRAL